MNKWSVVGLLSCLGVASLAHAHSTSSAASLPSHASGGAAWSGLSRAPRGLSVPRRKSVRLGGQMPCIAPQLVRPDQGLGAYQDVPAEGGHFTVLVWTDTAELCGRGVSESSDFVADLKGNGTDHVEYTVLPNTGAARTAVLLGSSGNATTSFELRQAAATKVTPPPAQTPPAATAFSNDPSVLGAARTCGKVAMTVVKSGAALKPDTWVLSPSRQYKLIYQTDGNLVLYRASGEFLWSSNKLTPGGLVKMQVDGNLVSYNTANKALWASNTSKKPSSFLGVQDDGNVVVYGPNSCTAYWSIR